MVRLIQFNLGGAVMLHSFLPGLLLGVVFVALAPAADVVAAVAMEGCSQRPPPAG